MSGRLDDVALEGVRAIFAGGIPTDEALLGRFNRRSDDSELAFATLVDRHGPAVFRACRAVLGEDQAARDAFQATFLVLARKAGTLRVRDSLGPWLLAVAVRVAASARVAEARRRKHEGRWPGPGSRSDDDPAERSEVVEVVREELSRLPERLRAAVIACDLEGLGHEQAARRLGWPIETVKSRQARGREALRVRLARRGLGPAAFAPIPTVPVRLAMPGKLARKTVRAALVMGAGSRAAGVVPSAVWALVRAEHGTMLTIRMAAIGAVVLTASALAMASRRGEGPIERPEGDPVVLGSAGAVQDDDRVRAPLPPAPIELETVALAGETVVAVRDEEGDLVAGPGRGERYQTAREPLSLVAIIGVFDQRALQHTIRDTGPGGRTPIEIPYRRVDLQRQRLGEAGEWTSWETVDPEASMEFSRNIAFELEDRTPGEVRYKSLVSWIPFIEGWQDDQFPLVAERFRERSLREQDRQGDRGFLIVKPEERLRLDRANEPALMIRAVDPTVVPGETYRYRARVVIDDPRSGPAGRREIEGEWSEATGPIEAIDPADRIGGREPEGSR